MFFVIFYLNRRIVLEWYEKE